MVLPEAQVKTAAFLIDRLIKTYWIDEYHRLEGNGQLVHLVIQLARAMDGNPHILPAMDPDDLIVKAENYIRAYYTRPITTADVARVCRVSREHLSRAYHRALGYTIAEALRNLRMQRACRLLDTSDAPVREIAAEVGYLSPSAFGKAFTKALGVSPRGYRRRQGTP